MAEPEDDEAIGKALGQLLADIVGPIEDRLAEAERRCAETESKLAKTEARLAEVEAFGVRYCGVWQAAGSYRRGSLVTDGGSMWHCNGDDPHERPGTSSAWSLAVKRGKDGKDATIGKAVRQAA
jgi:hypothetical protein